MVEQTHLVGIMNQSHSNALSPVTTNNHQADLWIVTVLCLIFISITCFMRCYVRLHMLGADDWVSFTSTCVGVIQYAVVFASVTAGAGKASELLDSDEEASVGQLFLTSEVIATVAVYLSKATVTLSLTSMLPRDMKVARLVCNAMLGFNGACGAISLVTVTARCSALSLLTESVESHCANQTKRWIAITILDGVTEVGIFAIFSWILWPLMMRKALKAAISSLFALRLLCPVFNGIHALYISHYLSVADRGLAIVGPIVWQQIDMSYALFSALGLVLSSFLKRFNTRMGMDVGYVTSSNTNGNDKAAYELSYQSRHAKSPQISQITTHGTIDESELRLRPEKRHYTADITHLEARREPSVSSNTSQRPIIRCHFDYVVAYEEAVEDSGWNQL